MSVEDPGSAGGSFGVPAGMRGIGFPKVRGRSLIGVDFALPSDLPGELTLVVVAFERWQQERVDRWIERAVGAGLPPTVSGARGRLPLAVVELPVLSFRWRPVRRMIDGGMTAGTGNPDILARTITVYTNVRAFQTALGIPGSDDVHALVVRPDGSVVAHESGEPNGAWETIATALATG